MRYPHLAQELQELNRELTNLLVTTHVKRPNMRIITTKHHPEDVTTKAVIKYDNDWEEYRILFYVNGKYQKGADYHTADIDDAKGTATLWLSTVKR